MYICVDSIYCKNIFFFLKLGIKKRKIILVELFELGCDIDDQ